MHVYIFILFAKDNNICKRYYLINQLFIYQISNLTENN